MDPFPSTISKGISEAWHGKTSTAVTHPFPSTISKGISEAWHSKTSTAVTQSQASVIWQQRKLTMKDYMSHIAGCQYKQPSQAVAKLKLSLAFLYTRNGKRK